jgi:hypothetical protein
MTAPNELRFSSAEMARIERARKALLTSRADLIRFCVLQGLDELDSLARDQAAVTAFYARHEPHSGSQGFEPSDFDFDQFERSS